MSTPAPLVYRYTARFPVNNDLVRPALPIALRARFNAVDGVIEYTFGEDVSAWTRQRVEEVRIEARRIVVEVVTYSADVAAAETVRRAVFAELERIRQATGGEDLIIVRDAVEAFALPPSVVIGEPSVRAF